jgi:hypothetical protein
MSSHSRTRGRMRYVTLPICLRREANSYWTRRLCAGRLRLAVKERLEELTVWQTCGV